MSLYSKNKLLNLFIFVVAIILQMKYSCLFTIFCFISFSYLSAQNLRNRDHNTSSEAYWWLTWTIFFSSVAPGGSWGFLGAAFGVRRPVPVNQGGAQVDQNDVLVDQNVVLVGQKPSRGVKSSDSS